MQLSKNLKEIQKKLNSNPKLSSDRIKNLLSKTPSELFNPNGGEFANVLHPGDENSFLDVSIVLKHCEIWNDEHFLKEHGEALAGKFPIKKDGVQLNVENLFSFLMHDWFFPEPGQTYAMVTKLEQFGKVHKKNLFEVLFGIIDDQMYKKYRHVVVRLLYQYLFELSKEKDLKSNERFSQMNELENLLLAINDQELKTDGIKVVAVFWLISCTDDNELEKFDKFTKNCLTTKEQITKDLLEGSEMATKFLNLCYEIKNKKTTPLDRQAKIDQYLNHSNYVFGDYMPEAIGHNVMLLSFLARKETLSSTVNYIEEKFPDAHGTTILTFFERARAMTGFKVHKFKSQQLETLVSSNKF